MKRRSRPPVAPAPAAGGPGRVRIIGGRWRGSRLDVACLPGLRPTSDRTRETLFNWLQGVVPGARCLDLFAGSGALGIEAASRGASAVVMVERDVAQARSLRATAARLQHPGSEATLEVVSGDALAWLRDYAGPTFDLVFLDPPFDADPWAAVFTALEPHLSADARVYVESPVSHPPPAPASWKLLRSVRSREARANLYLARAADTLAPDMPARQDPDAG